MSPAAVTSTTVALHRVAVTTTSSPGSRVERAWAELEQVLDPEVPVLSVLDLGIVRDVVDSGDALEVVVTPTKMGAGTRRRSRTIALRRSVDRTASPASLTSSG